jgi:hypothetical protein
MFYPIVQQGMLPSLLMFMCGAGETAQATRDSAQPYLDSAADQAGELRCSSHAAMYTCLCMAAG